MRQLSLYEAFAVDRPLRRRAAPPAEDAATTCCYVCHEPTTETCRCACKATVHADCLLKCVRASGMPYCTICLGTIANLRVPRWRRITRRHSVALVLTGLAICYYSVFTALMVGLYVEEKDPEVATKHVLQGTGSLVLTWAASKLFLWMVESRDRIADHAEYEYG